MNFSIRSRSGDTLDVCSCLLTHRGRRKYMYGGLNFFNRFFCQHCHRKYTYLWKELSCFSEAVMSHVAQYNNLAHKHVPHKPQCKIDSQRLHRKYWFHINGVNSEWKWGVRTQTFKTRSASTRPLSLKHFFEGKVYFVSIWNLMKLFRRG